MLDGTLKKNAWATLLSDKSYVPGCLVLLSSLKRGGTKYPLVVMVFPLKSARGARLPLEHRNLLRQAGCVLREIDWLVPAVGGYKGTQTRYLDNWSRLRAFGLLEYEVGVKKNMDELLDLPLEADWIAASHPCACNPLRVSHYPPDWIPSNCGHTYAVPTRLGSDALCTPFQPNSNSALVLHLIGAGLVVLTPSDDAHNKVIAALHKDSDATQYTFVEQDFLARYFKGRIKYLGYEYNAVKPMRECHKELWRDEGVRNVHYVLKDKPWSIPEGSAALDEQFRVVHGWWWDEWRRVESEFGNKPWWGLVTRLVTVTSPSRPLQTRCKL
ncbi:hypothetical protein FRC07_007764 [Ceratobasidium sp. 392]|nr:hypothetical protein FRC07_007764 [Ceratobasidium sp. 392]